MYLRLAKNSNIPLTGLNCLGLGDMLRRNPNLASVVFPSIEETVVDVELFNTKLKEGNTSCDGARACQAWEWFLQFVEMSAVKKGNVSVIL